MTEADVLLFPCLHEEAGAVVVEARAAGLPVVCLDRGGPRLLIGPDGIRVSACGSVEAIARRLAEASKTCLEARRTSVANPRMESLTLAHRAQDLQALLMERLDLPSDTISAPPGG
jgi:glycosyltransferase involved in cell wall biosynthesis